MKISIYITISSEINTIKQFINIMPANNEVSTFYMYQENENKWILRYNSITQNVFTIFKFE